jgi:hypothetical protein
MSSYPYDGLPVRRALQSTDWKSVVRWRAGKCQSAAYRTARQIRCGRNEESGNGVFGNTRSKTYTTSRDTSMTSTTTRSNMAGRRRPPNGPIPHSIAGSNEPSMTNTAAAANSVSTTSTKPQWNSRVPRGSARRTSMTSEKKGASRRLGTP